MHISDDAGNTWTALGPHGVQHFGDLVELPDGSTLAAEPQRGIRCSVDGGRTWATRCNRSPQRSEAAA